MDKLAYRKRLAKAGISYRMIAAKSGYSNGAAWLAFQANRDATRQKQATIDEIVATADILLEERGG